MTERETAPSPNAASFPSPQKLKTHPPSKPAHQGIVEEAASGPNTEAPLAGGRCVRTPSS